MFTRYLIWTILIPGIAQAADLEKSMESLVTAFTSRILPVVAFGYLGKNIFSHIQGNPNARDESIRIAIAIVCLIGISGVWQFLKSQVK